jgi:DNA-binding NarL/FixJ family response regulator
VTERSAPLRVLLADDHVTVRHGLKLLIDSQADMKVVSEASDGKVAMQNALALKPDVIVMDISMPGMNGLAATPRQNCFMRSVRRPRAVSTSIRRSQRA